MKIVIFGLTVSSSWGNGHATLWRALIAALLADGHRVAFFERDVDYYAHNRDLRVSTGQKVRRAQVIATVGESGKTSGPQLHFEVRVDGKPVDPLDYLGPLPAS